MTYLPSSATAFTIPSVYDGVQLECRVYLPRILTQPGDGVPNWRIRGAIVAHPYAPLGGCCGDPVVSFVGGELLEQGYVVGTFNFRYVPNDFLVVYSLYQCNIESFVVFYFVHSMLITFQWRGQFGGPDELDGQT